MINSRKEGKYLVFDLGEKGSVKYDLSTQQYIGKKGKPVTNLCSQLRGVSIEEVISSFPDEAYKKFLKHVHDSTRRSYYYSNVGTFLTKIADYTNYEQFFTAGIAKVDLGKNVTISQVPKRIIKLCKDNPNLTLNRFVIDNYNKYPNIFNVLFEMTEKQEIEMFSYDSIIYDRNPSQSWSVLGKFLNLVNNKNYKVKSLVKYIDNIMLFEGINSTREVIELLSDYVDMSSRIAPKYEKYPRYLKTVHDIAVRNYNRLKEVFDEEEFAKRINKDMEFKYENYVFLYPNTTKDIKQEAVQQSNCVASYIKRVIEGNCHIMFMRDKSFKDNSLVTLEISPVKKEVVQAKGLYNRQTTDKEEEAIKAFNLYLQKLENKDDK